MGMCKEYSLMGSTSCTSQSYHFLSMKIEEYFHCRSCMAASVRTQWLQTDLVSGKVQLYGGGLEVARVDMVLFELDGGALAYGVLALEKKSSKMPHSP